MTVVRRLPALGLVVAVVIGLGGCSSDSKKSSPVGSHDGGGDSAGGAPASGPDATVSLAHCGGFGRVAACTACLEKNCCDVATACAKSGDCTKAVACIRPCDGKPASCQQACATSAGSALYNPLVTCMFGSCQMACPSASP